LVNSRETDRDVCGPYEMPTVKLGPLSALLLSIGCTAESSRPSLPMPPPAPAPVASTHTALPPEASATVVCVPLPRPATPAPVLDSSSPFGPHPVVSIDSLERLALRTAEGKVSRQGSALRIQLLAGRTAVYQDDTTPGMKFALPRYAGYLKTIHLHVVHRYPYEGVGGNWIVDDSTGDSTFVFGDPVASPDGKRFVLTSMSGEAWYDASLIEVWRMVGRKPEKEFSFNTEESSWEASDPLWRDSLTIDFLKNRHSSPAEPYIQTPACLSRTGTTWVLSDSLPRK
jgi:hypothetical protein